MNKKVFDKLQINIGPNFMRQIPAIGIIKVMIWHFHDLVKNINSLKHIQLYNKKTCLNYDNS